MNEAAKRLFNDEIATSGFALLATHAPALSAGVTLN